MVPYIKENKLIIDISFDMCIPFQILLQLIVYSVFALFVVFQLMCLVSEWRPYTVINVLASDHVCYRTCKQWYWHLHSTLDMQTLGNKRRGLNRRWARLNAGQKSFYRK